MIDVKYDVILLSGKVNLGEQKIVIQDEVEKGLVCFYDLILQNGCTLIGNVTLNHSVKKKILNFEAEQFQNFNVYDRIWNLTS